MLADGDAPLPRQGEKVWTAAELACQARQGYAGRKAWSLGRVGEVSRWVEETRERAISCGKACRSCTVYRRASVSSQGRGPRGHRQDVKVDAPRLGHRVPGRRVRNPPRQRSHPLLLLLAGLRGLPGAPPGERSTDCSSHGGPSAVPASRPEERPPVCRRLSVNPAAWGPIRKLGRRDQRAPGQQSALRCPPIAGLAESTTKLYSCRSVLSSTALKVVP